MGRCQPNTLATFQWLMVLGGFISYFIADGCTYSVGILFTEFRNLYQYNSASTSILPALIYALPQFMSPFLCPITDVVGYSTSAAWGALFLCLSFLFTSFAKSMELTYFSFGLVTAIGLQLTYTAAFMAVVSTFKDSKYFGIACGIMVSGGGIGAFATNHMIAWILSQWTLREALVIQAAFLLHAWFSAALFYWVDESAIIEEQFRAAHPEPQAIQSGAQSETKSICREPSPTSITYVDRSDLEQHARAKHECRCREVARLWFLCPVLMILTPSAHRPRVQRKNADGDLPAEEVEDCSAKSRALCTSIGEGLKQLFSRKVWTNLGFLTFVFSNGLCAAGVVIPWTFIYDYVYQIWLAGMPVDSISSEVDAQIAWYPSLIGLGSCCGQVIIGIISSNINKKAANAANLSVRSGDTDVAVVEETSRGGDSDGSCCRRFWNMSKLNVLFAAICLFNGIVTIAFTFIPIPSAKAINSPDLLILNTSQGSVLAFASFMVGFSDGGFMTMLGLMLQQEVEEQYFPAALGICLCITGAFNFVGTVVGGHIFDVFATYTPAMLLAACLSFTGFLLFVFVNCIRPRASSRQKDVQFEKVAEIAF